MILDYVILFFTILETIVVIMGLIWLSGFDPKDDIGI